MPISDYMRDLRSKVGHMPVLMPAVTVIVRDEEGRILLTKNADADAWLPIGGAVELDEAPEEAAVSEMKEETGLVVEPVRLLGVYGGREFRIAYPGGDVVAYVTAVYECRVVSGEMAPDGVESLGLRYFSEEETGSLPSSAWVSRVLKDAFASDRKGA